MFFSTNPIRFEKYSLKVKKPTDFFTNKRFRNVMDYCPLSPKAGTNQPTWPSSMLAVFLASRLRWSGRCSTRIAGKIAIAAPAMPHGLGIIGLHDSEIKTKFNNNSPRGTYIG